MGLRKGKNMKKHAKRGMKKVYLRNFFKRKHSK